jgi:hypothetical protein
LRCNFTEEQALLKPHYTSFLREIEGGIIGGAYFICGELCTLFSASGALSPRLIVTAICYRQRKESVFSLKTNLLRACQFIQPCIEKQKDNLPRKPPLILCVLSWIKVTGFCQISSASRARFVVEM